MSPSESESCRCWMQNFLKFSVTLREALDELVQSLQSSLVVVRGHRFGAGAGIIWDSSGLILTNQHVVGEDPPVVLLPDNREVEARLVAQDAQVDLALLAVQAPDLTAVRPAPPCPVWARWSSPLVIRGASAAMSPAA